MKDPRAKIIREILASDSPEIVSLYESAQFDKLANALLVNEHTRKLSLDEIIEIIRESRRDQLERNLETAKEEIKEELRKDDLVSYIVQTVTPKKGDDYYTEEERDGLLNDILEKVPKVGRDFYTDEEQLDFRESIRAKVVSEVLDVLLRRKEYEIKEADIKGIITRVISELKLPDYKIETPESLAQKLNSKKGIIDAEVIKGSLTIEDVLKALQDPKGKYKLSAEHILNMPARGKLDQRWHGSGLSEVFHDNTLTGKGTETDPLHVVGSGSGTVESVTGLNTDNTDPANPIVKISVDGVTIIGQGTPGDPLVSVGGSGIVDWTRTLIVDQGGKGNYTTIKAAVDFTATQSPSSSAPWQVLVLTGEYMENPFTIPSFVTVNGFVPTTWGNFDSVVVDFSTTLSSGVGIDMSNNSDFANIVVKFSDFVGGQTGDITLINGASKLTGVYVQGFAFSNDDIIGVSCNSNSSYITGATVEVGNFGAGGGRGIVSGGSNTNLEDNLIKGYVAGQWGYENTGGTATLYGNVVDAPSSILRTAGSLTVIGTSYTTASGTITFANNFAVEDEAYGPSWDGSLEVPTKNALYDKIETLGGVNVETPSGTVNGSNTIFTVSNAPKWVVVDSMTYFAGFGYTYLAGTITMDPTVPPTQFIRSIY